MRIVRPIVKTVDRVPQRVRDLNRLRDVASVLVRHGFGLLVAGIEIPGLAPVRDRTIESTPARALAALQDLGPTFVKLGQVLSTRPDLLPDEYIKAFEQLQDDVGPMPPEAVVEQLTAELGPSWRDRVATFDHEPLATASIAQVHTATLHDGREVVFKVQRPGLARTIRSDLNILFFLAAQLQREFPELDSVDMEGALHEFERSILSELDFVQEARNQRRVAELFEGDERVRIPEVIGELTTARVLCMERLRGVKIREAREAGHDMRVVGDRYLGVAYDMLFVHGFFHGDMHPGNVLVLPGDVLGMLDFGMMGRLTEEMKRDVIFIVFALQRGDYRTIARLYYEIAIKTKRVDYQAVERDTIAVMEKHWSGNSIRDMQLGPYVMDLARAAAKHGARVPPAYTMFFKAIVTSEGLAKSIIHEVDPIAAAQPYFEKMIRERVDLDRLQGDALYHVLTLSSMARRLPISLSQFLDDLDAQRVRLNVRPELNPAVEDQLDRRHNRMIAAVLTVGFALCGTLALFSDVGWRWNVPWIAVIFWVLSAGSSVGTLWRRKLPRSER